MSSQNYPLEENEKLLYSEDTVGFNINAKTIYWLMVGILGFPFYAWIIMVVFGCVVVGMSLQEIWAQLKTPIMIFIDELVLFIPFSLFAAKKIPAFITAPGKIMVTNKRILILHGKTETGSANVSNPNSLVLSESRFEEITYIATEIYKDRQFVKVKVKTKNFDGDMSEQFHTYQVKDARAVYAALPSNLVQLRGHLSPAGAKERKSVWGWRVLLLIFLGFMLAGGFLIELQENTNDLLIQGHKAIKQQKFDEAERVLSLAYGRNNKLPFQLNCNFGPVCYKLALTKLALGKADEAVPLFSQAVLLCKTGDNKSNSRALVFRSHARLGHIYQNKNDEHKATEYYEKMLQSEPLETKDEIRNSGLSAYVDFLNSKGHSRKARQIQKIKGDVQTNPDFSLDKIWE